MSIGDFAFKMLPKQYFIYLRNKYYKLNKSLFKKLTEKEFKYILTEKLGVAEGMVVFIHSSIDKLNLGFPPHVALNILLESVGHTGTILFPAWQYSGRAEDYLNQRLVFNVKRSPAVMGLLPEIARRHKNAFRSLHPTASIVAIGNHAEELLSQHHLDIYPCGVKSPLYKMMKYDARIIGLGEKVVSLSFVHCVEDIMKERFPVKTLTSEIFEYKVIDNSGSTLIVKTLVPHKRIQNRDIPLFFRKYINSDICEMYKFHGSNYFCCHAGQLFSEMKMLAQKGITIY